MPEKTKKTAAKKTAVKKVATKPAVKKTVAKKTPVKKVKEVNVAAPVVEMHPCGCDKSCPCGGNCQCKHHHCGFWKKFIVVLVFFALGFAAAKMLPCGKRGKMPKPEFDNGCLVVKCPKMAEMVPQIDLNSDGCIDKTEFRAFKKHMRAAKRAARQAEQDASSVVEAPIAE